MSIKQYLVFRKCFIVVFFVCNRRQLVRRIGYRYMEATVNSLLIHKPISISTHWNWVCWHKRCTSVPYSALICTQSYIGSTQRLCVRRILCKWFPGKNHKHHHHDHHLRHAYVCLLTPTFCRRITRSPTNQNVCACVCVWVCMCSQLRRWEHSRRKNIKQQSQLSQSTPANSARRFMSRRAFVAVVIYVIDKSVELYTRVSCKTLSE